MNKDSQAGLLNTHECSLQTFTAITMLHTESNPADKDKMVELVMLLLGVSRADKK